jgi:hypothetical protein
VPATGERPRSQPASLNSATSCSGQRGWAESDTTSDTVSIQSCLRRLSSGDPLK